LSAGEFPDLPKPDLCSMLWSRRCMIAALRDEVS
jgi:hypothetical protein